MVLLTHPELECLANTFCLNYSNTPSEAQKNIGLNAQFFLILAQRAPLSTVIHSLRLKNFNH